MISVVIPLYNKEQFIGQTINSLQSQTFKEFEALFVDDGSTDRSPEIVKNIQDERIKLIQKPNGGPSSARNLGVEKAKYEWILYLDADDYLLPNTLEVFYQYISKVENFDCIFGNFFYERNGHRELYSNYKERAIKNNFKSFNIGKCMPRTGAAVYRKKILKQYPFREDLKRYEDVEQLFRLFKVARFYRIKEAVFVYNANGCEAKFKRENIKEDFSAYLKLGKGISWENIAIYKIYILARQLYPRECSQIYPEYSKRLILHFLTRLFTNKYIEKIYKLI